MSVAKVPYAESRACTQGCKDAEIRGWLQRASPQNARRKLPQPRSSRHVRPFALRTPETSETVGGPLGQTVLSLVTGKVLQLPQRGRWVEISELNTNVHPSCWCASLCSELSMAFYVSSIRGLVVV